MMTQEEINLKLGLDGSGFAQGVRSVKGQISDFADTSGKAFTRSASAAKGFKQALHEISDTSPIMGAALKLAISPIGGMLMAATAAFAYFKNKIDETNKELDRLSELAAKPVGNMPAAMEKARQTVADLAREHKKWWDSIIDSQDEATKGLKEHLDVLDAESKTNDKILEQNKEKALFAVRAKEAAGVMTPYEAAVATHRVEQTYATENYNRQLKDAKDRQGYLNKQKRDFEMQRDYAATEVDFFELHSGKLNDVARMDDLPGRLATAKNPEEAARLVKAQLDAKDKLDDAQKELDKLKSQSKGSPFLNYLKSGGYPVQPEHISAAEKEVAKAADAYKVATGAVDGFHNEIKKSEDALFKHGEAVKNNAEDLERAHREYEKYEAARKTAEEGAKQAGTTVTVLTKEGKPFVQPAEPKRGMFNPTLEQLASSPNPNQQSARRAMQIPNLAIQARLRGDNTGADKLESEYNDLMFGKETDMFGETTGGGPINGPPPAGGEGSMDDWNKKHGIAYHSKYDDKTKLGGLHRTGGLQGVIQGQGKDYLKELYNLINGMAEGDGKSSKLRIKPAMDQ